MFWWDEREKEKGRSRVLKLPFSTPSRLWAAGDGVWREDCVKSEQALGQQEIGLWVGFGYTEKHPYPQNITEPWSSEVPESHSPHLHESLISLIILHLVVHVRKFWSSKFHSWPNLRILQMRKQKTPGTKSPRITLVVSDRTKSRALSSCQASALCVIAHYLLTEPRLSVSYTSD